MKRQNKGKYFGLTGLKDRHILAAKKAFDRTEIEREGERVNETALTVSGGGLESKGKH